MFIGFFCEGANVEKGIRLTASAANFRLFTVFLDFSMLKVLSYP